MPSNNELSLLLQCKSDFTVCEIKVGIDVLLIYGGCEALIALQTKSG